MKIKAQNKLRPKTGSDKPAKKMSLAAQKAEQAYQKGKNELNLKIKLHN